jgi:hypothetical protein
MQRTWSCNPPGQNAPCFTRLLLSYRTGIPIRTENEYLEPVRRKWEIISKIFEFIYIYFTGILIKKRILRRIFTFENKYSHRGGANGNASCAT